MQLTHVIHQKSFPAKNDSAYLIQVNFVDATAICPYVEMRGALFWKGLKRIAKISLSYQQVEVECAIAGTDRDFVDAFKLISNG